MELIDPDKLNIIQPLFWKALIDYHGSRCFLPYRCFPLFLGDPIAGYYPAIN